MEEIEEMEMEKIFDSDNMHRRRRRYPSVDQSNKPPPPPPQQQQQEIVDAGAGDPQEADTATSQPSVDSADKLGYDIFSILESKFLFGLGGRAGDTDVVADHRPAGGHADLEIVIEEEEEAAAFSGSEARENHPKLEGGGGVVGGRASSSSSSSPASSAVVKNHQRGKVCILSIDGGAGMSSILIGKALVHLERTLREKSGDPEARISDFFDVAAGTGIGGIFISMLFATFDGVSPLYSADDTWRFLAHHGHFLFLSSPPNSASSFEKSKRMRRKKKKTTATKNTGFTFNPTTAASSSSSSGQTSNNTPPFKSQTSSTTIPAAASTGTNRTSTGSTTAAIEANVVGRASTTTTTTRFFTTSASSSTNFTTPEITPAFPSAATIPPPPAPPAPPVETHKKKKEKKREEKKRKKEEKKEEKRKEKEERKEETEEEKRKEREEKENKKKNRKKKKKKKKTKTKTTKKKKRCFSCSSTCCVKKPKIRGFCCKLPTCTGGCKVPTCCTGGCKVPTCCTGGCKIPLPKLKLPKLKLPRLPSCKKPKPPTLCSCSRVGNGCTSIFRKKRRLTATTEVEAVLKDTFGEKLTLRDTLKPVVIPCYDLITSSPFLFTRADAMETSSFDFRLWEVCRATWAEPGRVDPAEMVSVDGSTRCEGIDGGLVMSNPTAASIAHVLHNKSEFPFVRGVEDVLVLSLGASGSSTSPLSDYYSSRTTAATTTTKSKGSIGSTTTGWLKLRTRGRWKRKKSKVKHEDWARPIVRIASHGTADLVDQAVGMAFHNCRSSSNYVRIQPATRNGLGGISFSRGGDSGGKSSCCSNNINGGRKGEELRMSDMDRDPSEGNVEKLLRSADEMLQNRNVESVLFGGMKRVGEHTNADILDWLAARLVTEHRSRSSRIAPTVAFRHPTIKAPPVSPVTTTPTNSTGSDSTSPHS